MAKKIKISQLPDATDLNGLYIFGKGPGTQNVKAPMSLLRGNTAFYEWQGRNPGKTYADWIKLLQEPAQLAADGLEEIKTDITGFGVAAKAAEAIRIENEAARKASESGRISGENQRMAAEIIREENEEERLMAEEERKEAETDRKTSEVERKDAEAERKASETLRRQNEVLRVTTEDKRMEAEITRAGAEALRDQAETGRNTAEELRDLAETIRITSEIDRMEAETGRAGTEAERISSEKERKASEVVRITSEHSRSGAEAIRNNSENERQTATAEAIANAEKATVRAGSAAAKGEKLNAHQPVQQVNEEGVLTWWVWDLALDAYTDTGLSARGPAGKGPVVLPNGNYGNWDEELGAYADSDVKALATIDLNTLPVVFAEAGTREEIRSGETLPGLFGKIKKWLTGLGRLAWKDTVDYDSDIDHLPDLSAVATSGSYNDLTDKPSIPKKTTDISNDSDYRTGTEVDTSIASHNASAVSHEDVREKLSAVEAIARGKARALIFDTVEELDEWLVDPANIKTLQTGDNLYITALDIPDFWWDGNQKQPLETEKPDLSVFYTKEESGLRFSNKPVQKRYSIMPEEWMEKEEGGGVWMTTVQDEDIREGCSFEAWPFDRDSKDMAAKAEFDENVTVRDGSFTITALYKAAGVINIIYTCIQ
jgi:hypothetical protein